MLGVVRDRHQFPALQSHVDAHAIRSALEDARAQHVVLLRHVRLQVRQQSPDRDAGNEDIATQVMDERAGNGHPAARGIAGLHVWNDDDHGVGAAQNILPLRGRVLEKSITRNPRGDASSRWIRPSVADT